MAKVLPLISDAAINEALSALDVRLGILQDQIEGLRAMFATCRRLVPTADRQTFLRALTFLASEEAISLDQDNIETVLICSWVLAERYRGKVNAA